MTIMKKLKVFGDNRIHIMIRD